MSINITLVGQMITFLVFVFFTMYVVWPVLENSLEKRRKFIIDGLQAAEEGHRFLKESSKLCAEEVVSTKTKCNEMLESAKKEAFCIRSAAVESASSECELILQSGRTKLNKEIILVKIELQKKLGDLILLGTEKLLQRSLIDKDHAALFVMCNKEEFKLS